MLSHRHNTLREEKEHCMSVCTLADHIVLRPIPCGGRIFWRESLVGLVAHICRPADGDKAREEDLGFERYQLEINARCRNPDSPSGHQRR